MGLLLHWLLARPIMYHPARNTLLSLLTLAILLKLVVLQKGKSGQDLSPSGNFEQSA